MSALPHVAAVTALAAALFSPVASAACFLIYAPDGELIYRSIEPPVDMSYPLHQTLPKVAPGGKLIFSLDLHGCELTINKLSVRAGKPASVPLPVQDRRADRG